MRILLFCLLCPRAFADEGYDLALDRDWIAGTKVHLEVKSASKMETKITPAQKERPPGQQSKQADLKGMMEVLEPGKFGSIRKARITVESCQTVEGDKPVDVVPPGTVVDCDLEDDVVTLKINGEAPDKKADELLKLVVNLGSEDGSMTELFHTEKRAQPNQTFALDSKVASEESSYEVDPKDISGELQVGDVSNEDGLECITVCMDMTYKNMKSEEQPGFAYRTHAAYAMRLPTDVTLPVRQMSVASEHTTIAPVSDSDLKVEVKVLLTMEYTCTPIQDK